MSNRKKVDVVHQYKQYLFGAKKFPPQTVFTWLLQESPFDIKKVVKEFTKKKTYEKYIFGNALPISYDQLGQRVSISYTEDIDRLLYWMAISFDYYYKQINHFLILKEQYEYNFLLGNFAICEVIIEQIEKEVCVSLWSIENRLIIAEYDQGLERNKEVLREINTKNNSFVSFMADFLSRRTEKNVSVQKYTETTNKYIQKIADNDVRLTQYLNFKLNFPNYSDFNQYAAILYPELSFSIIDRYISFIQVCKYILAKEGVSQFITVSPAIRQLSKIDDYNLHRLNNYLFEGQKSTVNGDSQLFISLLDNYTSGNFEEAVTQAKEMILKQPNRFELYEVYIKSLYKIDENSRPTIVEASIIDEILHNLQNILLKNEMIAESLSALRKYITILGSTSFNNQMYAFLLESTGQDAVFNHEIFRELNSAFVNPRMSSCFQSEENSLKYLSMLADLSPNSKTISFYIDLYRSMLDTTAIDNFKQRHQNNIHEIRPFIARILQHHKDFNSAIFLYEELMTEDAFSSGYIYQDIVTNLYSCYLDNRQVEKALNLLVKSYHMSEFYIVKFDVRKLIRTIETKHSEDLNKNLAVVIVYHLHYIKTNEHGKIYGAYANFIAANNINKPSEINIEQFQLKDLVFFLKHICVPEMLDSSVKFEGVEDIEAERVKICQLLSNLDKNNSEIYLSEIGNISKKALLRKRLQEIDESKIHVDIKGIQKLASSQFLESFIRFKEISKFSSEDNYKVMDVIENLKEGLKDIFGSVDFYFLEPDSKGLIKVSKSQHLTAYKELFLEIRDHFISSNEYGLDTYLSIKIRHGTFLNHMRSVFKAENLITEKNKTTNDYIDNSFWLEKIIQMDDIKQEKFSVTLNEFSKAIDDIITNVSSKWLQIKTEEKNHEGLFNYVFTDSEIYKSMVSNKDAENHLDLMNLICEELWIRTEFNLSEVRGDLSTELKSALLNELNKLEQTVKLIFDESNNALDLFYRSIAKCGTDLQNQIEKVSKWFTITENKTVIDFSIQELFETCMEITNTVYPNFNLKAVQEINSENTYKGFVFTYFVDIFIILLDNVVKYSNNNIVHVTINESQAHLTVNFKNKISNLLEKENENYYAKIEEISKRLGSNISDEQIRKEGGSGFYKIMKILKYDLSVQDSAIDISCLNGEFIVSINLDTEGIILN